MDAQADLSLRWAHMSEGTFSHVPVRLPRLQLLKLIFCFQQINIKMSNVFPLAFVSMFICLTGKIHFI